MDVILLSYPSCEFNISHFHLIYSVSVLVLGYRAPEQVFTLLVNDIPNFLLSTFAQQGSVHASSIYKGTSNEEERSFLGQWIRENLVSPTEFQLDHDHSLPPNLSPNLEDYRPQFLHRGFEIMWDVGNDNEFVCPTK